METRSPAPPPAVWGSEDSVASPLRRQIKGPFHEGAVVQPSWSRTKKLHPGVPPAPGRRSLRLLKIVSASIKTGVGVVGVVGVGSPGDGGKHAHTSALMWRG
ncbi:hypothetical protein EYF80_067894 [Liparis tanakae]|uniref:Uncharacterized protein n=1 Tax=Liparis tanakae TaxID=230148 RepID=A0A4Z2DZP4_9TELE|nr:hypothetical protein EYF80_067894 [Liparis tanakae]